jgi:oxygen-dependent protoporphyrinogen oxidase
VPKSEGRQLFACTFVHNKFPGRAAKGRLVLRAFLATGAAEVNESAVAALVQRELGEILGISTAAEEVRVFHWRQAMAQYEVGHLERVKRVESLASRHRGLHLAGNAYDGIGLPDCIRTGREAAERITAR